jgi:hypothetical protein
MCVRDVTGRHDHVLYFEADMSVHTEYRIVDRRILQGGTTNLVSTLHLVPKIVCFGGGNIQINIKYTFQLVRRSSSNKNVRKSRDATADLNFWKSNYDNL